MGRIIYSALLLEMESRIIQMLYILSGCKLILISASV